MTSQSLWLLLDERDRKLPYAEERCKFNGHWFASIINGQTKSVDGYCQTHAKEKGLIK